MPQTPQPAGKWFGNALAKTAQTAHGASVVKAALLSNTMSSSELTQLFAPSSQDTWQQPPGSNHPTVTATIGASGQALVMASSIVFVGGGPQLARLAFSYTYTPQGGSPITVGPNGIGGAPPTTELGRFGYSGGTGGPSLYNTLTAIQTFSGLPQSAQVQFDLWFQSGNAVGAEFSENDLTVLPL